jgi:hypothetical protein
LHCTKLDASASGSVEVIGSTVTLAGSGASVALDTNATVQGTTVKLGSGSGGSSVSTPSTKTTLVLVDDYGRPLPNQRVIVRTGGENGEERTLVLDADGRLEIDGTDSFDVFFPDVVKVTRS